MILRAMHEDRAKFEHLPSLNLVWHDLKLQHGSSNIVGIEEPFGLNQNGIALGQENESHLV